MAGYTLRRHTPKVGAVCGKAARTVLCGGRSAMSVPTAIAALAMTESKPKGFTHDPYISAAKPGRASAAAVAGLQEHGEALAHKTADPDAAHAFGTDRAGLWPRDGARKRQRPHAPAQGRAARRTHHRSRPCAR